MRDNFSGWELITVGELVSRDGLQTGPFGSQLKAEEYTDFGIPTVMPSNMENFRITTKSIARVPEKKAATLAKHRLQIGDVIFARRGDIGRCALVTETEIGWLCGSGSLRARLNPEKIIPEFVIQHLSLPHSIEWLRSNAVGQTMLNLSTSIVAELPLHVPPLPEQRKIAQILGTWDEAIATTEKLIATLERRKQGLMQRLLTGQVRFPGFVDAWKVMQLGEFLRYTPRKVKKPTTAYNRMGIRSHGKGTFTGMVEDPNSNAMDYLYVVKADDLIVNITFAWEQAIAIVAPEDEDALVSHRFPTYTFRRNRVISEFFRYLMLTKRFLYQLDLITPGGAGRNRVMSKTDFLKLTVKVPSIAEQTLIGEALGSVDQNIKSRQLYLAALREQKKGLMQRLLTGQVRVAG